MSGQPGGSMDSDVLLRYLGDQSPGDERCAVEAWLSADEANRAELVRLDRAWRLATRWRQPVFDVQGLWARIRPQLDQSPAANGAAARPRRVPPNVLRRAGVMPPSARSRWARGAARGVGALAAVALAAVAFRQGGGARTATPNPAMRSYTTQAGERAELRLVDGSRVVLNGETTLRVPEEFGGAARDVYLDGAAYFDVTHDSARAFRVHTSRMTAEDLGTRFTITAYTADSTDQVAVAEGMVGVEGKDSAEAVILEPNDVASVSRAGVVSATRGVAVDRYFGWVDGVVQFDEVVVSDAARILERQFGVELRVPDSALAARRITGPVRAATLYDDLRELARMLGTEYERDGRVVTLGSHRRSAR